MMPLLHGMYKFPNRNFMGRFKVMAFLTLMLSMTIMSLHALTQKETYAISAATGAGAAIAGLAAALSYGHQMDATAVQGTAQMALVGSLLSYVFFRKYLSENDFERTWKPRYLELKRKHISFFIPQQKGGFAFDWAKSPQDFESNLEKEEQKKISITYNPASWYRWASSRIFGTVPLKTRKNKKIEEANILLKALQQKLSELDAFKKNFEKISLSNAKKIEFDSSYNGFKKEIDDVIAQLSKNLKDEREVPAAAPVSPSTSSSPTQGGGVLPGIKEEPTIIEMSSGNEKEPKQNPVDLEKQNMRLLSPKPVSHNPPTEPAIPAQPIQPKVQSADLPVVSEQSLPPKAVPPAAPSEQSRTLELEGVTPVA